MKHAQDHFSAIAAEYSAGRITYPEELYEYLSSACREKQLVWDCATGSGQAAVDLSSHFDRVIATDISDSLLALASNIDNVMFRCAPAEDSGIEPESVDLVAVAQAIHWFEHADFWKEVSRVLKPGGVLAFWGYVWPTVDDRIDVLPGEFKRTIAHCWPKRSHYLQECYKDIEPPFGRIESPDFHLEENWTVSDYLAHLASWSGIRYFRDKSGEDPLEAIKKDIELMWGQGTRIVRWALVLKVYRNTEQDADDQLSARAESKVS